MGLNQKYTALAVNTKADAQAALLNDGFMDLYDGVQPIAGGGIITTQVRLARLTFGNPAFAPAVNGVSTANPIGSDAAAAADGVATWVRCCQSNDVEVVDGSVGTSGCNLNLNETTIMAGAPVGVTGFTLTEPRE